MRIAVLTCFHQRAWLSALWLRHTQRSGLAIYGSISTSDTEHEKICEQAGIRYTTVPNEPLGAKHNAALRLALGGEWDAVMILPSDDFVDPLYLERAKDALAKGADYVVPDSCGMYDVATGRACILWQREAAGAMKFGAGRIVSRMVVERIGDLWTDGKARGLDTDSNARIRSHGIKPVIVGINPEVPCLTDVKTDTNLWGYDQWFRRGVGATPERVLGMVEVDVADAIKAGR